MIGISKIVGVYFPRFWLKYYSKLLSFHAK